jgi:hypothetical protein
MENSMKSTRLALLSISLVLSLSSNPFSEEIDSLFSTNFAWQNSIAETRKKNIQDYFLLLPSVFLDCENVAQGFPSLKKRLALITKNDPKNGYLAFMKNSEIALFRNKKEESDFLVVQIGRSGVGNTCECHNQVIQFNSNSKKWKIRDDLLPQGYTQKELYDKLSDLEIFPYFELPKKGYEIKVRNENSDSTLYRMKWDGTKFIITQ